MAKKHKPLLITHREIEEQVRRTWGKVRPVTRDHGDAKKEGSKKACRGRQAFDFNGGPVVVGPTLLA